MQCSLEHTWMAPLQVALPQGCPLATSPGPVPDPKVCCEPGWDTLPSPTATSPSLDTSDPFLIQSLS